MIINSCELEAIYGDIFDLDVECIVNPANNSLLGGGGLDGLIHQNDGEDLLDETVKLAGTYTGGAKITRAHKLKNDYIIHVVGPMDSNKKKNKLLEKTYLNLLSLADEYEIKSIAIPAISCGAFAMDIKDASKIAVNAIKSYLQNHNSNIKKIYISLNNYKFFEEYKKLLDE
ncbi:macro domain-containing protein [Fenollaria massiliensis]|uniref:Macro domain-containing protein n=1 Tax=Fenollaria massiliensis TaxID=938288 RepID=A0A9E7DKN6_9FIRM|nr:macro domain-containing protein [Fenollaria massiliensis]UQK59728.1 macro domain-containing protein [Fenollaria massiliensis]